MTVTAHAYSAKIVGTSTAVPVEGGRITLDAGMWPHVTGSVQVPVPTDEDAAAFLAALDPRLNRRLEVTAQVTFDDGQPSVTRKFNLGIRSRPMRLTEAGITLDLASDEALLEDYRALATDREPYNRQTSLRSICNYVLNKAIPGAALAAQPAIDRNVTAYWELENLINDPRATSADGFVTSGGSSDFQQVSVSNVAATGITTGVRSTLLTEAPSSHDIRYNASVSAGRMYTFSVHGFIEYPVARNQNIRAYIAFLNQAGNIIPGSYTYGSSVAANVSAAGGGSGWKRVSVTAVAPPGSVSARIVLQVVASMAVGSRMYATGLMITEGADLVPYFDGDVTNTSEYAYTWQGAANNASSLRIPINERDPESLVWDAGRSAIDFLMTLVQSTGLRLVCDEQRVWTLRDENYTAPGQLDVRYAINMLDADDDISRDTDTWFDAMVATWRWTAPDGTRKSRTDSYALPGATRVAFVERETAFPGKGFAQYAVRRAQGRGREVSGSIVADWAALAEQPVTIVLPSQATQIGITQRVEFDLDNDRITVSSRTRDTPAGAIDLLQGTIDGLTGSIDSL